MRKLVWGKEIRFEGFKCNSCGWLIPNPTINSKATNEKEALEEAQNKFTAKKWLSNCLKAKSKSK
jgi:hypothetical protein